MPLITKPDFTYVWASGGAVVAPNDSKKQLGWVAEAPPFQYDNWLQNRQDQMLAHINQRGIAAWDALTNYEAGGLSYVQGSDGKIYKSVAASGPTATVQNPTTDGTDTYWAIAFADVGAFLTQTAGDVRYPQRSNNLSDISNAAAAFGNIKQAATETVTGVVELATAAEAQGFVADKFIDGAKLAEAFRGANLSLAANGYQKFPSGLILQWGTTTQTSTANGFGPVTVTLPLAFPSAIFCLTGNLKLNSILNGSAPVNLDVVSLSQIAITLDYTTGSEGTGVSRTVYWSAIGN